MKKAAKTFIAFLNGWILNILYMYSSFHVFMGLDIIMGSIISRFLFITWLFSLLITTCIVVLNQEKITTELWGIEYE